MKSKYKVVIIGSKPSSLATSLFLNKYNVKDVLIIGSKDTSIIELYSEYITQKTANLLKEINIDIEKINYKKITNLKAYYNNKISYEVNEKDLYLYFLDAKNKRSLYDALLKKVKSLKLNIIENYQNIKIETQHNKIIIDKKEIKYDNLIISNGYNNKNNSKIVGIESRVKRNKHNKEDLITLHFNQTQKGYGWITHLGEYTTIGLTEQFNENVNYREKLKLFAENNNIQIDEKDTKEVYIPNNPSKLKELNHNIVYVGSAAGLADPTTHEELYYSIVSAKNVARAISKNKIYKYEEYMKPFIKEIKLSSKISKIFYTKMVQDNVWRNPASKSFKSFILKKVLTEDKFKYSKIISYLQEYKIKKLITTPKKIELLIFDMDGTLWDTVNQTTEACNIIAKKYKDVKKISKKTVSNCMGLGFSDVAEGYMPYLEKERREEVLKEIMAKTLEILQKKGGTLYPSVIDVIKTLNKKYKLAIITNNFTEYAEIFVKHYNLENEFYTYLGASSLGKTKSEAIKYMINKYKVEKAVYIGDTKKDMLSAKDAGTYFIHAKYGFDKKLNTKYEIKKIKELPSLIEKIKL